VGQYASNSWGFFDMHGNVREWVYDWHATYSGSPQTDPTGPAIGLASGLNGVVPGTSTGRTCVLLSATTTPRATATTTLASVSVSKSSSQRREEGVIRLAYFFPWSDRVDCRVGFQGNPSRNHKALDGRMTDRLTSKWRSAAGLAKRGVSPKGPCQQAEPRT
jgi:formylglycine-generating enzyme required for sulfatase activity